MRQSLYQNVDEKQVEIGKQIKKIIREPQKIILEVYFFIQ